jgi:hypothetical protein
MASSLARAGFSKVLASKRLTSADHALSVGLAVIDLATARKDGERRARRAFQEMLDLLLAANADLRTAKDIGALQDK